MNKLKGIEIETLFVSIEHRIVFMDKYFTMKSAFFVLKDIKRNINNNERHELDGVNPKLLVGEIGNNYLVVS